MMFRDWTIFLRFLIYLRLNTSSCLRVPFLTILYPFYLHIYCIFCCYSYHNQHNIFFATCNIVGSAKTSALGYNTLLFIVLLATFLLLTPYVALEVAWLNISFSFCVAPWKSNDVLLQPGAVRTTVGLVASPFCSILIFLRPTWVSPGQVGSSVSVELDLG